MSKVTVAFVSFIVGSLSSSILLFFMLSGSHTSVSAQEPPKGGFVATNPALAPVVRALTGGVNKGVGIANGQQPLDGFACDDCTFKNVDFTYGGGPVRITNPKFSGTIRLTLYGAAANTIQMVAFLDAVTKKQAPAPVIPNAPIIRTAQTTEVVTADLITPYGQK